MAFFWTFVVTSLIIIGLLFHRRTSYWSWGWNFLLIVIVLYVGLYWVSGSPRNPCFFSALSNLHGDLEVVNVSYTSEQAIYLLVRTDPSTQPIFVSLPWSGETIEAAMSAMMNVEKLGGTLMVRSEILSECRFRRDEVIGTGLDNSGTSPLNASRLHADAPNKGTEGGEPMFYPKPVASDPFKTNTTYHNIDVYTPPPPDPTGPTE